MKSLYTAVLVLIIVIVLVVVNSVFLSNKIDRLFDLQKKISPEESKYFKKENNRIIDESLQIFEDNRILFHITCKKRKIDNPKIRLRKLKTLSKEKNHSDYLTELEEYSKDLIELKNETSFHWQSIF